MGAFAPRRSQVWAPVAYVLSVMVLVVDVLTDRTFATGVVYLPLVLLASLTGRLRTIVGVTCVGVAFTVLGAFLSPVGADSGTAYVVANRLLSIAALLACGWLASVIVRSRQELALLVDDLRQAEATVASQHRLLAIAGEVGRFGGWSVDVATGVGHWSREVGAIIGVDPDGTQTLEQSIAMYAPDHQDRLREVLERCVRDGTPFEEEFLLQRVDDGRRVWVNASGRADRGPDGTITGVHGAVQDITARREAEIAAEQSNRRLQVLADAMPVLVWRTGPEGDIDYFSKGLLDYTGTPPELILGAAWLGVLHPDDRDHAWEVWSRSVETEAPYSVEFRIRRYDGEYRWHLTTATAERDESGRLVAWWGSCVDIDDRRVFEQQAHDLAERLTWTLESVSDAVLGLDQDWRVTVMNDNAATLLMRSRESLMGKVVWEEFPDAVGSIFQTEYERAVSAGETVRFEAEYPPIGRHLEISANPHSRGLTVYFRDITESRRVAEQLAHEQRLDSLGRLTGGVAHDFNNLLTVILGSAEVLAARLADDPVPRRLAESICSAARRGADLTHSLLAFARKQPLDPTVVDVNELLADTERLLGRTLGGDIALTTLPTATAARCVVDRGQLENAVLNLCINARDAMPGGGRLVLETAEAFLDEQYAAQHPGVEPGHYVTLAVSDDGAGIPRADLDHVFEPFFTTKESGKGSGLGLAMVYGFVTQSHGHVSVDSHPGSGTTVRLYLPMAANPVAVPDRS